MTELEKARAGDFTWGRVVRVEEIGPYAIVVFHSRREDKYQNGQLVARANPLYESRLSFHPYVGGRDTSTSWGTLDEALVFAIAYRNSDWNVANHVAPVFLRGLSRRR